MMNEPQETTLPSDYLKAIRSATPTWFDYFFVFAGCGISLVLVRILNFRAISTQATPDWMMEPLIKVLPEMMFLPVGIIVWWPLFFVAARIRGRSGELSWVEWFWGLLWLLNFFLVGSLLWVCWKGIPEVLEPYEIPKQIEEWLPIVLWAIGGAAVFFGVITAFSKKPSSWTHHFGLVLISWPAVVMALVWLGKLELRLLD